MKCNRAKKIKLMFHKIRDTKIGKAINCSSLKGMKN